MAKKLQITGLKIPLPKHKDLDADLQKYFSVCEEKLGFVPNVLQAYSFDQAKLRTFIGLYNELMLAPSSLSKLEREMIAVVVSSANRCYYCLSAHGAAVRSMSKDPERGEMLILNWRTARLSNRQHALLQFAHKLTLTPADVDETDRAALRKAGLKEKEIWDAASIVGFFNFTNRVATATDMQPNPEYRTQAR